MSSLLISFIHSTWPLKTTSTGLRPQSHIFSADLPGVRKEEIKEVEDSIYLIIRTHRIDEATEPSRNFMRKFWIPGRVDLERISAGYEDGVLTVTVPRSLRTFFVDPADNPERLEILEGLLDFKHGNY